MPANKPIPMTVLVPIMAIVTPEEGGGFSASVPALPGCYTQGDTLEEVQANVREAATGWLEARHDLETARPDAEAEGAPAR